jgi:hypothetical protein
VSPALNSGIPSRSWRCSIRSMGLAMVREVGRPADEI